MFSYVDGATTGPTIVRKRKKSRSQSNSKPKHDIPLEERLKEVLASTSAIAGDGRTADSPSTMKAEELVVTLIKGLHSSDQKLIDEVLNTLNLEIVKSTVRRLPVQSLLPLLREITVRIRSKVDVRAYIRWLHVVLSTHLAYLSSVPEIVEELCSQHQIVEARVSIADKFLRLQGRLGILLDQFSDKSLPHERLELSNKAAKAVFIEEPESEEELEISPMDDQQDTNISWNDLKWSDDEEDPISASKHDATAGEDEIDGDEDQEQSPTMNGGNEHSDDDDNEEDGEDESGEEDDEDEENEFSPTRLKRKRELDDGEEEDELMNFS